MIMVWNHFWCQSSRMTTSSSLHQRVMKRVIMLLLWITLSLANSTKDYRQAGYGDYVTFHYPVGNYSMACYWSSKEPRWDVYQRDSRTIVVWVHQQSINHHVNCTGKGNITEHRMAWFMPYYNDGTKDCDLQEQTGKHPYAVQLELDKQIRFEVKSCAVPSNEWSYRLTRYATSKNVMYPSYNISAYTKPSDAIEIIQDEWYMLLSNSPSATDPYFFKSKHGKPGTGPLPKYRPWHVAIQTVTHSSFYVSFRIVPDIDDVELLGYEIVTIKENDTIISTRRIRKGAGVIIQASPNEWTTLKPYILIYMNNLEPNTVYENHLYCYNRFGRSEEKYVAVVQTKSVLESPWRIEDTNLYDFTPDISIIAIKAREIEIGWTDEGTVAPEVSISVSGDSNSQEVRHKAPERRYTFRELRPKTKYVITLYLRSSRTYHITCETIGVDSEEERREAREKKFLEERQQLKQKESEKRKALEALKAKLDELEKKIEKRKEDVTRRLRSHDKIEKLRSRVAAANEKSKILKATMKTELIKTVVLGVEAIILIMLVFTFVRYRRATLRTREVLTGRLSKPGGSVRSVAPTAKPQKK
ncbi:hypothetical protein Q1695_005427 [Nippostrongylus brasiliensis]|nr:hypothetical protein Q1695_005427 [Nippostrongylus brasiliensis]